MNFKKKFTKVAIASVIAVSMTTAMVGSAFADEYSQLVDETQALQNQLLDLITKIDETEQELQKKNDEIQDAKFDLEKVQNKEKKQYRQMKKRIKFMYESGNAELFAILMDSKDVSELLNKAEYISSISDYDRQQLVEFVKVREEVATLKDKLEKEEDELEAKGKEYEKQTEEVSSLLESKQAQLANIQLSSIVAQVGGAGAANISQAVAQAAGGAGGASGAGGIKSSGYANDIVARAYAALGMSYVYGACNSSSTDCSGLVSYALTGSWNRIGTSATFGAGTKVQDPQPGDVCCINGHVGVYVGNGEMIHAMDEEHGVVKSKVQDGMWFTRY